MKLFSRVALVAVVLLMSHVARADSAQELNDILKTFDTIHGRFTQTQVAEDGEVLEVTENEIFIKRPGLFRLHVLSPYEQVTVTNRKKIWEYDPEFQEVVIRPYDPRLEQSPAALLSGDIDTIRQHYEVTQVANNIFKLKPLSDEQGIELLELEFEQGKPALIRNHDSLGQTITFKFNDVIVNQPIDDGTFNFKTPAGVEEVIADG